MIEYFKKYIDQNTTLFLDRDGVLNIEKENDYIKNVDEFIWYDGVLENFHLLNKIFNRIIIVTNQRGIGKELMTVSDLHSIHTHLNNELNRHHANIDAFYFAPEITDSVNRKPNIGMALQAKIDFPQIDFSNSIMVGNNLSDLDFGKRIGATTVLVETTTKVEMPHHLVDFKLDNFVSFCKLFS
jgi:histidinol phosphatase-like enzyme